LTNRRRRLDCNRAWRYRFAKSADECRNQRHCHRLKLTAIEIMDGLALPEAVPVNPAVERCGESNPVDGKPRRARPASADQAVFAARPDTAAQIDASLLSQIAIGLSDPQLDQSAFLSRAVKFPDRC
jgi:hypothetical protein